MFQPVCTGPTASRSRLEPDTPWRCACIGHAPRQRHQLIPVLWDLVSGATERLRVVPDLPLDRRLDENPDLATLDLPQPQPVLRILLLHCTSVQYGGEIDEPARSCQLCHLARPRQTRHVRRISSLDSGRQNRVEITGALVLDVDASSVLERLHHGEEARLLITTPGREHTDGAADALWSLCLTGARLGGTARGRGARPHDQKGDQCKHGASDAMRRQTRTSRKQ
jgi:hypothetical protein